MAKASSIVRAVCVLMLVVLAPAPALARRITDNAIASAEPQD